MKNGNITGSIPPLRSRRNHIAMQGQEVEVVYALTAEPATHCASCGCQLFEGRRRTCKKKHLHKRGDITTNADATVCIACFTKTHKDGKHTEVVSVR